MRLQCQSLGDFHPVSLKILPQRASISMTQRYLIGNKKLAITKFQMNIAITIPKQHSDTSVGLPTRVSSKVSPAFSGFPPMTGFRQRTYLSTHTVLVNAGLCTPFPCSALRLTDPVFTNATPLRVFFYIIQPDSANINCATSIESLSFFLQFCPLTE